jgi:hypothetical protein
MLLTKAIINFYSQASQTVSQTYKNGIDLSNLSGRLIQFGLEKHGNILKTEFAFIGMAAAGSITCAMAAACAKNKSMKVVYGAAALACAGVTVMLAMNCLEELHIEARRSTEDGGATREFKTYSQNIKGKTLSMTHRCNPVLEISDSRDSIYSADWKPSDACTRQS